MLKLTQLEKVSSKFIQSQKYKTIKLHSKQEEL